MLWETQNQDDPTKANKASFVEKARKPLTSFLFSVKVKKH